MVLTSEQKRMVADQIGYIRSNCNNIMKEISSKTYAHESYVGEKADRIRLEAQRIINVL